MIPPSGPDPSYEPSVWDYLIGKLSFRSKGISEKKTVEDKEKPIDKLGFPWFTIIALLLAILAQLSLEPSPARAYLPGVILYTGAFGCLVGALFKKEWHLPDRPEDIGTQTRFVIRWEYIAAGLLLGLFTFVFFGNGRFGFLNTTLWILSILFTCMGLWEKTHRKRISLRGIWQRLRGNGWNFRITHWTLIVLGVISVILFFNFHRLDSVPPEMVSDQAEKLLDIYDILNGSRAVYFPRNTGREVLHFYLTAVYMGLFNLEVSFLNLKVVTVFANLLTLLFIYMLGKEIGDKWVGLGAAFFAGIAYWPLLFTRLALRIPYYPLFVAPVMYFVIRGLRRQSINDILWSGIFLGLGLHGYTPFRIVPILVVAGILIYVLHVSAKGHRLSSFLFLFTIGLISLLVFIPLLRFWLSNPHLFAYRAFSRLTGMEAGFVKPPLVIFFENFWDASLMFFWNNGVIWAHSIPGRPALEVVSGALYFLGVVGLLIRFLRRHDWVDLFLLISIPILMLPSILSLAYPGENPSLNRSAGAVVPVFIVISMAFTSIIRTFLKRTSSRLGRVGVSALALGLLAWSGANNYDLVFNQHYNIYRAASWNTSELGRVAEFFIESIGSPDTTFLIGYPHWVDSRLVAINSGQPGMDYAIFPEQVPATAADPRAKLFFVHVNDQENLSLLGNIFPDGVSWRHDSRVPDKDFMIFFIPPDEMP